MKKVTSLLAAVAMAAGLHAQTNPIELRNHAAAQKVLSLINNKHPDSVYFMFDSLMQNSISSIQWNYVALQQIFPLIPIKKMEYLSFSNHSNYYSLSNASQKLWTMQLATNDKNEISTLFLAPVKKTEIITNNDNATDAKAQLIKKYYNEKNIDSLYGLTNASFQQKITKDFLKQGLEAQLFPYGPIVQYSFVSSKNGVSKYKADLASMSLQVLVGLDKEGKVETFVLQPYKEELAEKRADVWHDNALASPLDSLVHTVVTSYMAGNKTPGISIGVLQGTKGSYYNYGLSRINTEQHPLRGTLYEIGSITKTMTAFLLADAVVNGKAALSDPITKYLPADLADNADLQAITLEHLANHTSGLSRLPENMSLTVQNPLNPYADYDTTQLFTYLSVYKAERKPGEQYEYSNLGFGLLGTLLEKIYQQPLEDLYQQIIFKPFKMTASYSTSVKDSSLVAAGYNAEGGWTPYWDFQSLAGCGAVKSNAEDLLKYAMQFTLKPKTNGKVDPRIELLEKITYEKAPSIISLGWHFDGGDAANRIMHHSGGTYGFRTNLAVHAPSQLAIVVLCNDAEEPGAPVISEQLQKALIGAK